MLNAKFVAEFEGFFAACQTAEVHLKSLETDAVKVGSALTRMTESFSGRKVIQDAALMTRAIDEIGGISKLTAKELQAAGAKASEAVEKMKLLGIDVPPALQKIADAAKVVPPALNKIGTESGVLSGWFKGLVGDISRMTAAFVSAQAIIGFVKTAFSTLVGFVKDSVAAAGEAEKAHVTLVAALRAQGTAIPSVISAYTGYATALQRTTVFQDDALEGAAALLVQIGNVMPRDMEKALKATTNLASGLGIDLDTAVRMVAKSAEGNVTSLKKVGVTVDEVKLKQEGFTAVLDKINEKFGGQAAAAASTYQGRLEQLGNTWNNVEESIGRAITTNATVLDLLGRVNGAIDTNTGELRDNRAAANFVSDAVILAVKAFALLAGTLDTIQSVGATTMNGLREMGRVLGDVGRLALHAARGWALFHGDIAAAKAITPMINKLGDAVDELARRNEETIATSDRFSVSLHGIRTKADALAAELTKTRGKTVELKDATDGSTDAWGRNTTAANAGTETQKKAAAAFATTLDRVRAAEVGIRGLTGTLPGLTDESFKAYIRTKELNDQLAKIEGTSVQAWQAVKPLTEVIKDFSSNDQEVRDIAGAFAQAGIALEDIGKEFTGPLQTEGKKVIGIFDGMRESVTKLWEGMSGGKGITGFFSNLGGGIVEGFGNLLSGGISSLIGTGIDALVGGFKKLFGGVSEDVKKARVDQEAFIKALTDSATAAQRYEIAIGKGSTAYKTLAVVGRDALLAVGKSAAEADRIIRMLLDTDKPKNFAKAMQEVQDALDKTADANKRMLDAVQAAIPKVASGFNDIAKALEGDNASLETMGLLAQTAFAAAIAGGATLSQALAAIKPGLDSLQKTYKDLGVNVNDVGLAALLMQSNIAGANPALMAGIDAAAGSFDNLNTLGLLNADTFAAMQLAGAQMYTRLQAETAAFGGSTRDALIPMQGFLHEAEEAAKLLGIPLDANTQLLIDQSKELGIWKDKGKTATEILDSTMKDLVKTLQDLIEKLGGIKKGVDDIPANKQVNIDVNENRRWFDRGQGNASEVMHLGGAVMHQGGMIEASAQAAARILPFVPRAHSGLAVDERLIVAQTGEGILSRRGMARLGGAALLNAINRGEGSGGGGGNVSVSVDKLVVSTGMTEAQAAVVMGRLLVDEMKKRGVRFSQAA